MHADTNMYQADKSTLSHQCVQCFTPSPSLPLSFLHPQFVLERAGIRQQQQNQLMLSRADVRQKFVEAMKKERNGEKAFSSEVADYDVVSLLSMTMKSL